MAKGIFQRGPDSLMNGVILGAIVGALIVYGQTVYDWVVPLIPEAWLVFGDLSIPIILIGLGALIGYLVDRF